MSLSTVEDEIHLSDSDILWQQFYDIELVTRQILLTNAMVDGDDGEVIHYQSLSMTVSQRQSPSVTVRHSEAQ